MADASIPRGPFLSHRHRPATNPIVLHFISTPPQGEKVALPQRKDELSSSWHLRVSKTHGDYECGPWWAEAVVIAYKGSYAQRHCPNPQGLWENTLQVPEQEEVNRSSPKATLLQGTPGGRAGDSGPGQRLSCTAHSAYGFSLCLQTPQRILSESVGHASPITGLEYP